MTNHWKLGLASAMLCLTFGLSAQTYRVEDVPMVYRQDSRRHVSNPDGILTAESVAEMDRLISDLEKQTGIQILVAALTDIEGGDCFDFAYRLGEENGIGQKKKDNGLVMLLVTAQRCVQFATGYGLEGDLPDARCKRIQERYMLDAFRQGDWSTGMLEGVRAVCQTLDGTMEADTDEDDDLTAVMLFLLCLIVGAGGIGLLAVYLGKRCPACGKHKLQRTDSVVMSRHGGIKTLLVTYRCTHCGHTLTRQKEEADENYRGPNGRGPFVGGGFGSGGGFGGGGSFGGGSFGGGGAGSRF